MGRVRAGLVRLGGLFHRQRREREMAEELESHLQMHIEDNLRSGMTPEEARRQAIIRLGGIEQVKEECRDTWGVRLITELVQDLRYGTRQLRRNSGFTAAAAIALALGVGATTSIFSVVNAVLLRPLPFSNPSRLVAIHEAIPKMGYPKMGFAAPDFEVFERVQESFSAIGAYLSEHVDISGQGAPVRVTAARVSASLFPMLGAQPMLGRSFTQKEDEPGYNVAVLSYRLWQRHYGGDTNIIGQAIQIDQQPYTVIGVMPRSFEFPLPGSSVYNGSPADLWVPIAFTTAELRGWGGSYFFGVIGRLRPGTTLAQAQAEGKSRARIIMDSYPTSVQSWVRRGQLSIGVIPLHEDLVGSVRTLLLVLMAAVALVLLIACANVATMLLSRGSARQGEFAIRVALGATRFRLIRQMLTESTLLAFGGSAMGLVVAYWARNLIVSSVPGNLALLRNAPLNWEVFAFAVVASLASVLVFGLAPAFQLSGWSRKAAPMDETRRQTAGRSHRRLQGLFVVGQFALGFTLLTGAGLLIRSLVNLLETNPGFRPGHVLAANVPLPRHAYPRAAQVHEFYRQLLSQASGLPGVKDAAISSDLPLKGREEVSVILEGNKATPGAVWQSWVLGSYFQTMGIPLLRGRYFKPEDGLESRAVAIVSSSFAQKYWPGQNPLGRRIKWGTADPWETVVGVVGNVSPGPLNIAAVPHVYRPYKQLPAPVLEVDPFGDWRAMNLVLRTDVKPASLASSVVKVVHSLDPELAVANVNTMNELLNSSFAVPRFNTILIAIFAGLALSLAAVGVYGVLAYSVVQRTHEIGIRMALGARQSDVHKMVLRQGLKLALIGVAIGIAGALALMRFLSSLLYAVKPTNALTLISAALILLAVALIACYIPARRAAKVDPMVALRCE